MSQLIDIVKAPYVFEFLGVPENIMWIWCFTIKFFGHMFWLN